MSDTTSTAPDQRSAEERIADLEWRLVQAETRIAGLEARQGPQVFQAGHQPVHPAPLGKDARCSYCGGALWVCRGVHNVC